MQLNRKPATYRLHLHFLKSFIGHVGKRMRPSNLKVHHVAKWHESLGVGSTTQNDAVSVVQRMLNWGVEREYVSRNPIKGMKKPKRKRRDVFYTLEQWEAIKKHADQPLTDLLDFLYFTGCRPKEARTLEARHLQGDLVVFPADESKGEHEPRVVYLAPESLRLVMRLEKENPEGALLRNAHGKAWTKNALVWRLKSVSNNCYLNRFVAALSFAA